MITGFSRAAALLVAGALFVDALDSTIVQAAAPAIAADLDVGAVDVSTAIVAYLLTLGMAIPATAWLAHRFGDRRVFVLGAALFTLASVACAASGSLPVLVAARAAQGLGGALMVPVGRIAVLRETPSAQMLTAVAYLTWPALVAPTIAPAIGGVIADTWGWRWIFLVNVPVGVVIAVAARFLLPDSRSPHRPRFDRLGYLLVCLAVAGTTIGAQTIALVGSAGTLAGAVLLAAGLGSAVAAIAHMRRRAHPLLDLSLLRIPTFRATNTGGGVYRMMILAVPLLITFLLQLGFGWSATDAGLALVVLFAGNLAVKPVSTPIIRRWGFRGTLIVANAAGALILLGIAGVRADAPAALLLGLLFLSGVFRSLGFSAYATLQLVDVPFADRTAANALSTTILQTATTWGVAVAAGVVSLCTWAADAMGRPIGTGYGWTFLIAAAIMLVPLVGAWRLSPDAGLSATRRVA